MENIEIFNNLVGILRNNSSASFHDGTFVCNILGLNLRPYLTALIDEDVIEISDNRGNEIEELSQIKDSQTYICECQHTDFDGFYLVENESGLYKKINILLRPVQGIYFHDSCLCYLSTDLDDSCLSNSLKNFFGLRRLISFLHKISEFNDLALTPDNSKLFFVEKQKLVLDVSFDLDQNLLKESGVFKFKESNYFNQDRQKILKTSLIELLIEHEIQNRVSFLVSYFDELILRYDSNYNLFMSDFSLAAEKASFLAKRSEYLSKIDNALSNAQNKAITIPLAFLLVTNQFKTFEFWASLAIFIGAIMYFCIIKRPLEEQSETIKQIENDFKSMNQHLVESFPVLEKKLTSEIESMNNKFVSAKNLIEMYGIINLITLILYSLFFLYSLYLFICSKGWCSMIYSPKCGFCFYY